MRAWLYKTADGELNSRVAAVMRIGVGSAVLLELISLAPGILALTRADVLRAPYVGSAEPISALLAVSLIGIWAGAGIAFTIGAFATTAAILLAFTVLTALGLDQQLYSNHLYLMLLMVGLLAFSRPGAALSVDAWRSDERSSGPEWPIALLRIQVSLVYLFAALSKLNPDFLSGTVLNSYLRADGLLALPSSWRSFELMAALSVLVIIAELMLAVGLWLPRWRRTVITMGLFLHLGMIIGMTLPLQLTAFAILMFSGYIAFIAPARGAVTVVWDDGCDFCRGWVTWFRRLDWLAALHFVPLSQLPVAGLPVAREQALEALHAVTARSTRAGFRAVTRVLGYLPISFLWAPLLELPPVRAVGDRAYRAVALRRTCTIPPPVEHVAELP